MHHLAGCAAAEGRMGTGPSLTRSGGSGSRQLLTQQKQCMLKQTVRVVFQKKAGVPLRTASPLLSNLRCLKLPSRSSELVCHGMPSNKGLMFDSDDYEMEEHSGAGPSRSAPKQSGSANKPTTSSSSSHGISEVDSTGSINSPKHPTDAAHAAGMAGAGIVGFFVAGWMAIISVVVQMLQPVVSLVLLLAQPLTQMSPARARARLDKLVAELPEGFWAKVWALWELPLVRSIRITASVANWGVRLPAIAALLLTQGSLLASQVSLPMLAPLLLGTGMMMNSIKANASFIIPRLGLMVVLLWMLWFLNSVIQTTWLVLMKQGRIDARTMSGARMITECSTLLLAGIVMLSMLGINVNALLLPAGVVLAIASRDLLQNLIAGFYLVLVQPFRLGDRVAVTCSIPGMSSSAGTHAAAAAHPERNSSGGNYSSSGTRATAGLQGWFEGVCEKVDLRYTVLRDGRRRLMVPNGAFVSREFMVYDEQQPPSAAAGQPSDAASSSRSSTPVIREGHITTELQPPVAPPAMVPGMAVMAAANYPGPYHSHQPYQQAFTAAMHHYQPPGYHLQHGSSSSSSQQVPADIGAGNYDVKDANPAGLAGSEQQGQQVQEPIPDSSKHSGSNHNAQGPPGYLPQGFAGTYVSIPVYYNLSMPAMPWTAGTPSSSQSGAASHVGSQGLHQKREDLAGGMHQPVPSFDPAQPLHNSLDQHCGLWSQQQQQTVDHSSKGRGGPHHRGPAASGGPGDIIDTPGPAGVNSSRHTVAAAQQQQRAAAVMTGHMATLSGLQSTTQQHVGFALPSPNGYSIWVAEAALPVAVTYPPLAVGYPPQVVHQQQQQQQQWELQRHPPGPQAAVGPPSASLVSGARRTAAPASTAAAAPAEGSPAEPPAAAAAAAAPQSAPMPLSAAPSPATAWQPPPLVQLPVTGLAAAAAAVASTAASQVWQVGISLDQLT